MDIYGWEVLLLTYLLSFYYARQNNKLMLALFFVLSLHHVIALTNAYVMTTFGASVDAVTFHRYAVSIVNHEIIGKFASGPHFYRLVLAFFYKLLGPSLLLGEELSILAFLLSCFVLIKIYETLGYSKHTSLLILLYGSLPSMILLGSVTLRESWQILLFMLTIYFCVKNLYEDRVLYWVGMIVFSAILALFHEGFIIFVFLLFGIMLGYQLTRARRSTIFFILSIVLMTVFLLRVNMDKMPELEAFNALSTGNALDFIHQYQARCMAFNPRTGYGGQGFFISFIYYMFAPFPWHITHLADIYAAGESLIRLVLLFFAASALYQAKDHQRQVLFFLFLIYFVMSGLWSLGTFSYGTSLRHHLVSYWLLIILLGAYLNHPRQYYFVPILKWKAF